MCIKGLYCSYGWFKPRTQLQNYELFFTYRVFIEKDSADVVFPVKYPLSLHLKIGAIIVIIFRLSAHIKKKIAPKTIYLSRFASIHSGPPTDPLTNKSSEKPLLLSITPKNS